MRNEAGLVMALTFSSTKHAGLEAAIVLIIEKNTLPFSSLNPLFSPNSEWLIQGNPHTYKSAVGISSTDLCFTSG